MKIYSIKEIADATKNLLDSDTVSTHQKNNFKKQEEIPLENEKIFSDAEKSISKNKKKIQNTQEILVLKNEIQKNPDNKSNSLNYKIKIKPEVKDHIINELYDFLKKKVKKNTLKVILDNRLEIKNLQNKMIFLESSRDELTNNYLILENKYKDTLNKYETLKIDAQILTNENNQLKIDNEKINKILKEINEKNKELDSKNIILNDDKTKLEDKVNQLNNKNEEFIIQNKELKTSIEEKETNLDIINQKNRSFEINNAELKNTVSRYIINTKNINEKINSLEKTSQLELEETHKKIKFYQDENVRLSSELLSSENKNEMIKVNLTDIESEKAKISDKIKELSNSIDEKTNIISTSFNKEDLEISEKLNDKEQKSLDEVIGRIFKKM